MAPGSRTTVLALAALALAGCSREADPELPAACATGPEAIEQALGAAPGEVLIAGETRLSECFVPDAGAGDAQIVGGSYLPVATTLAEDAAGGDDDAALRLGYLIGASRRGAERTQGLHAQLLHRLEQEAAAAERDSAAFRRGEAAGRRSG